LDSVFGNHDDYDVNDDHNHHNDNHINEYEFNEQHLYEFNEQHLYEFNEQHLYDDHDGKLRRIFVCLVLLRQRHVDRRCVVLSRNMCMSKSSTWKLS